MNRRALFIAIFLISGFFSLSAFENYEHIHDMAYSDDGEWAVISTVLDDQNDKNYLDESIWLLPGKMKWVSPIKVITFKIKGWTNPAVCYDKENKAFLVFHTDWKGEAENGIYRIKPLITADGHSVSFESVFTRFPESGIGYFCTNDCGIYLIHQDNTNLLEGSKIYKISIKNAAISWEIPDSLKNIKISALSETHALLNETEHCYPEPVTATAKGLIIDDSWYFDCKTEKLKKFSSKEAALEFAQKQENSRTLFYIACGIIVLLAMILAVLIYLAIKNHLRKSAEKNSLNKKEVQKIIYDTQELERANISRDVHDSVIQDMRGIRIETELLHVQEDSVARQNKIENIATECVVKLRNICYNLTPAELTTHIDGDNSRIELVSIIQTLVQQFTERTNIPCALKVDPAFEYPTFTKEVSLNLFRVVQEALNNIEKHSYATNTSIFLKTENHKMKIFITDDGVGFDTNLAKVHDDGLIHFGLQMMKDRMDLIGGKITFISGNNDGTEVQLEIDC